MFKMEEIKETGVKVAKRLEGIEEYYFSKKLREIEELNKQGKSVINLGIGSPDTAPDDIVLKTLSQEASKPNVHGYQSYKGVLQLRVAIADWYKKMYEVELDPATEILPLIGSKEGIMHICMTYLNEGDAALIPNPGYPTYSSTVKICGATPVSYELKESDNWKPDFKELEKIIIEFNSPAEENNIDKRVKLLFANYPHMPTGQLPDQDLFKEFVAFAKEQNILIVHDNPYSFILNDKPMSMLSTDGAKDVVLELNSLSKSHSMAGWRIGMLCASSERINEVLRFKSNMDSGMFLPLQLAAAKALELGKEWHEELNKIYFERRVKVFSLLKKLDCKFSSSQAGLFVWAKVPSTYKNGYELSDYILYKYSVFITPGGIFGSAGNEYIRVSLCSPVKNIEEAIERIKL